MTELDIRPRVDGVTLPVRAQPGARKSRIVGVHDGALKVAVTAPPEDGRANQALTEFLSETLGVKSDRIRLIRGNASRRKVFDIDGLTVESLRAALLSHIHSENDS
jgi:uncharacterized protein (TIGR00251 family)